MSTGPIFRLFRSRDCLLHAHSTPTAPNTHTSRTLHALSLFLRTFSEIRQLETWNRQSGTRFTGYTEHPAFFFTIYTLHVTLHVTCVYKLSRNKECCNVSPSLFILFHIYSIFCPFSLSLSSGDVSKRFCSVVQFVQFVQFAPLPPLKNSLIYIDQSIQSLIFKKHIYMYIYIYFKFKILNLIMICVFNCILKIPITITKQIVLYIYI